VIGDFAFYHNQLTSVTIPDSVTTIGEWAFASNHLKNVAIPPSVTRIDYNAFAYNQDTPSDLVIRGAAGTEAERYAKENGHTFIVDDEAGYLYNTEDPGASVELPIELLQNVMDRASAVSAVSEAVAGLTSEQKSSPTGIDLLTLYAGEAAARAASADVGGSVVVTADNLSPLRDKAVEAKMSVEQVLANAGVKTVREIERGVMFRTDGAATVSVTIDPSAKATDIDHIRATNGEMTVTVPASVIKQDAADSPIVITITEETSALTELTKSYRIDISKPLSDNVKVSLPTVDGDARYQAVVRPDGTAVGGKFNPATGMIDVKISSGGVYMVKENLKDFTDIQSKPREMQEAIRYLASKGIINGTSPTTFNPDGSITRAEIAALIVRALGKLDPNADGQFKCCRSRNLTVEQPPTMT